ncbi:MAG: hypothetical protein UW64_C0023G0016 [Microgenomates group bacterium GW2011_GWC1_44_37]|uniref:Uncharacterized protein n=1 Tax=Candidatus Collierbacteria bacterium GW2011_GWB2_44_22 TaxID=1618387 RepID=A0A0G1KV40_9BACT|nr:MAG: hypothetical protein UW31_C0016G0021 [Candidatus Collierbacteria bacterium GW2011_GWA2_44_13]KKT51764.1 MAG: hypothetical protein UW44_C0008G0086 [Candidatus Collierbacteria bacterium GW2011_GWB2_44_22]KKT65481.1 MAG: hypothetical protein UW58_C0029G0021 [Candidatus Collierbacteria bacterium GW2011_GWC2_44_30]KKT68300.1 MAG: hypothetical protein UW64_C0023G0016 [Microgenomates group bacterium GW2011_GWC1_44_37]KKT87988.1 MAG: hypothetical protein UW88_C0017G0009 [Candidatus Collierbacte
MLNPDDFDDFEPGGARGGGGGGGRGGKKKRQGDKTVSEIARTAVLNQLENKINTSEGGEKSPIAEVQDVIDYVNKADQGSTEMKHLLRYIEWLKANINSIDELMVDKSEVGEMEKMTATLGAGGGGKDTSNNARRGTHLITGITAKSQDDRRAEGNVDDVLDKIKKALQVHLRNWITIMVVTQTQKERVKKSPIDLSKLEEEVLKKAVGD